MINFLKRHYILTAFLAVSFGIYIYLYFTDFRYTEDQLDRRWYSFSITEQHTTTIEYKTGEHVKYVKCLRLGFETSKFQKQFDHKEFSIPYNHHTLTDEEFYSETGQKPHFFVEIYKDGNLVIDGDVYIMVREGWSYENIYDREVALSRIIGYWGPRRAVCYQFQPNSFYSIKVTNLIPIDRYKGIETYLGFIPRPIL